MMTNRPQQRCLIIDHRSDRAVVLIRRHRAAALARAYLRPGPGGALVGALPFWEVWDARNSDADLRQRLGREAVCEDILERVRTAEWDVVEGRGRMSEGIRLILCIGGAAAVATGLGVVHFAFGAPPAEGLAPLGMVVGFLAGLLASRGGR